jgi:hypothetical protein
MFEPEPPASHLLEKVSKCVKARDAAHDPEIKVLWEVHAETLRRELRRLLDEMDGGVRR